MDEEQVELNCAVVVAQTRDWIDKAVIGLNLCPFAKPVYSAERILYCVSGARSEHALLGDLSRELSNLQESDPQTCETTLLIHPYVLSDFIQYNWFLERADAELDKLGLVGELQIASFHPRYQFADTEPEAIENYSNRSPYPILHILREASIERVMGDTADSASIYSKNVETLRRLGHAGWRKLWER